MKKIILVIVVCLTALSCRQKDVNDEMYYINGDTLSINKTYYNKMTDAEKMQLFIDKGIGNYCGTYYLKPSENIRTSSQQFLYKLIAANKYDDSDAQASFDNNFPFWFPRTSHGYLDMNYLDTDTRKFILDNLWESYKHDDSYPMAVDLLSEYYATGNGVKKNIDFSKYLIHRYDSILKTYKPPHYDEKWLKRIIK